MHVVGDKTGKAVCSKNVKGFRMPKVLGTSGGFDFWTHLFNIIYMCVEPADGADGEEREITWWRCLRLKGKVN